MRLVAAVVLAFFGPVAAGCVSNEYVIPHEDLGRLARIPPAERGRSVHAVQEIGGRRADAIPVDEPLTPPRGPEPPPTSASEAVASGEGAGPDEDPDVNTELDLHGDVNLGGGDGGGSRVAGTTRPGGWRGSPASGSGWRGSPAPAGGWRGSPGTTGGGAWHGSLGGGGHGSGGGSSAGGFHVGGGGGGGGGSGNIGEAAVVLAVLVVVIAAVAAAGLVASEGMRFDGLIELSPDQPVHLKENDGSELIVSLAQLTPAAADASIEAKVMDDEGYGVRRLDHVLDRRGATFKLDLGRTAFERPLSTSADGGPAAHVQIGYFFTPSFGLLATAALAGATDSLGALLTRHELGLELQSLPVALGPVHLGGYANGGLAVSTTNAGTGSAEYGAAFGAGALAEIDITGRMAFVLRGGADLAHFQAGWSPAANIAAGVSIY